MSIQLTITFASLITLSVILGILLMPMPTRLLGTIVSTIETSMQNKQMKVALLMFTLITALSFIDALRVGMFQGKEDIVEFSQSVWDQRAKKFYSQRNMYIFGFILFLQFALIFISMLIKSTLKNKTKLGQLSENDGVSTDLKNELLKKKADLETLKNQYLNNAKAYDAAFEDKKETDKSE